jgi:hypothetical protein
MQGLLSRATVNARKRGKNILEECKSAEKSRAMQHSIGILKDNLMYLETIPNTDGSPIKYRVINGQHRYHALTEYFNCHKTPEEDRTYDCKIWSDRLFLAANPDQQIWPDDSITVMRNIREILIDIPDAKIEYIQKIMSNKSGKEAVGQMRSAMKFPIGGCAVSPLHFM